MYNKVILIGRLTATPEMVKTASDRSLIGAIRRKMESVRLTLSQWWFGAV